MTTLTWSDIKARTRVSRHTWSRCLLTVLAGSEILMAIGAGPLLMVVGGLGGVALLAAAWVRTTHRRVVVSLVLVGTLPFAILGWTAVAPILVLLAAVGLAVPWCGTLPVRRSPSSRDGGDDDHGHLVLPVKTEEAGPMVPGRHPW